jgi:hypothetical protein
MEQYLKLFKTQADYESASDKPTVSHIVEEVEVIQKIDYSKEYLAFVPLEDCMFNFGSYFSANTVSYSVDNGETWTELAVNVKTPTITKGNKVLWKAENLQAGTSEPIYGPGTFGSGNKKFNVEGNIMSLLYGDDFVGRTSLSNKAHVFSGIFSNQKIVNAENLVLPADVLSPSCYFNMFKNCELLVSPPKLNATTLAERCYQNMFQYCPALTTAPELPATTLAPSCYSNMFWYCTSLTTAPELPATRLANMCYYTMFMDCTSLTTPPELPATTLTTHCYRWMFCGCTSLTTAPELPAMSTTNYCYDGMFKGCISLTKAPTLSATTLADSCYNDMFSGCTSLTDVQDKLPATRLYSNSYCRMFSDCTSLTTAPEISATTLASNSCYGMFKGCTSLTTAPTLSASTLQSYSYNSMFSGCTSLNKITCLATSISASNCTKNWVANVAGNGTFVKRSSMSSWTTGVNGIPEGWTVQNI